MNVDLSWRRVIGEWPTLIVAVILLSLAPRSAADEKPAALSLTFSSDTVTVANVDGKNEIIAFGIGIGRHGYAALLRHDVQAAVDEDGDGRVSFAVRDIPARSVWIAVDARSGEYVVATPTGELPRPLIVPSNSWRANLADLEIAASYLEVLLVRPGSGAWILRSADGGIHDADGLPDRKIRVRLDRMQKILGEEKGPPHAVPRDLLFAIDPQSLELFVSEAR